MIIHPVEPTDTAEWLRHEAGGGLSGDGIRYDPFYLLSPAAHAPLG